MIIKEENKIDLIDFVSRFIKSGEYQNNLDNDKSSHKIILKGHDIEVSMVKYYDSGLNHYYIYVSWNLMTKEKRISKEEYNGIIKIFESKQSENFNNKLLNVLSELRGNKINKIIDDE